jgi:hypothetical protein
VTLVRKRTIPTELPPLVGEDNVNFLRIKGVALSAQRIPTAINLGFLELKPLFLRSSGSSVILTRLNEPPFQTHYFSENLVGIEPGISEFVARNSDH